MNANINQYPGTNGFTSPPKDAIAYTVFVYCHIQGVGVTAYRIYNNVHVVKLKRWGQMEIAGKNSLINGHDVCEVHKL